MTIWKFAALFAALATLAGCVSPKLDDSDVRMLPYTSGQWPSNSQVLGLKAAIGQATLERPVKVLLVHGMISNKSHFSDDIQDKIIAEGLKLKRDDQQLQIDLERGYDISLWLYPQPVGEEQGMKSRLTRSVWRDSTGTPKLIAYELLWAPMRDDIKYKYFGCFEARAEPQHRAEAEFPWKCPQTSAKPNGDTRAWINGGIKDGLMVRGFADAVLANGASGDVLRDDLSLATCVMVQDTLSYISTAKSAGSSAALTARLVAESSAFERYKTRRCDASSEISANAVGALKDPAKGAYGLEYTAITHSLGSYFLMDAMARWMWGSDAETRDDVAQFAIFDQSTIYMFANQIALLNLGNLRAMCMPADGGAKCPNRRLQSIWNDEAGDYKTSAAGALTTYVAFNDVDDDLGFELPPYLADVGFGRLINVSVHNPAFWNVPFIIRNPAEVHTRQQDNPAVVDAVVNGIVIPEPPKR